MATDKHGLETYFGLIAVLSTLTCLGTLLQFQDEPPIPPSASEIEKRVHGEEEPPFLDSVQKFLQKPGFTKALLAFICSVRVARRVPSIDCTVPIDWLVFVSHSSFAISILPLPLFHFYRLV
jgi:hypothetical protein